MSGLREALERAVAEMPPARRLRFRLVLRELDRLKVSRATVLDAGCGEAMLAESIVRRHPGWRVLAVDASPEALDRARARLDAAGERESIELLRHDLTEPLRVSSVDAVTAVESLVEIEDDDAAIRQLARVLRPGGLLILHVPEARWEPVLPGSERTWRHEARHGYSAEEIAGKLAQAGLAVRTVSGSSRGTVRVAQEIRDRVKRSPLWAQAPLVPLMALAAWLELHGLTWGPPRALLVTAVRESGVGG